jgi:nitric oxide dioxygenase
MHLPGQYIGYQAKVPGHEVTTRNYSISSKPGLDYFRLTIKREDGETNPRTLNLFIHFVH